MDNKKTFYVYMHIRLDNGNVFYVGKGRGNRAYSKNRSDYWKSIVDKHDYKVVIVQDNMSEKDAFAKEILMIKWYSARNQCEANFTLGGEGLSGYKFQSAIDAKQDIISFIKKHNKRPSQCSKNKEITSPTTVLRRFDMCWNDFIKFFYLVDNILT